MQQFIYEEGLKRLSNNSVNKRVIFNLNCDKQSNEELIKNAIGYLQINNQLDLNIFKHVVIERTNPEKFYMGWHIDDCSVFKHKNKTFTLHHKEKLPIYTMIIYLTEYKKDFIGGELEFADGIEVKPKKYDVVVFDSKEVHRVKILKSGIRKNILVKFYN